MPLEIVAADTTEDFLLNWVSAFGTVGTWISDQVCHFKNEISDEIREIKNRNTITHSHTTYGQTGQ